MFGRRLGSKACTAKHAPGKPSGMYRGVVSPSVVSSLVSGSRQVFVAVGVGLAWHDSQLTNRQVIGLDGTS